MSPTAEVAPLNPLQVEAEFASIIDQAFGEQPLVIPFAELAHETETYHQAAHFIGAVAARATVEQTGEEPAEQAAYSLYEALSEAYQGDETARRLVYTNALTDVIERSIKSGFVMRIEWDGDGADGIGQHGQTDAQIQANSLRHGSKNPKMQPRFAAEVRNMFRQRTAYAQGWLEDYALLVPSRAADNMTSEEAAGEGFFTDTMSMAYQLTTIEDGILTTESAFVAGVARPGEARHDGEALELMGKKLKVDWSGNATKSLDSPVLIHKSQIPNGVIDVVALHDRCASEITGEELFFGEAKPRQDYVQYRRECREREISFQPLAGRITADLIAASPQLRTPERSSQKLNALSAEYALRRAYEDHTIDARVFGEAAAVLVEEARQHYALHDFEALERIHTAAVKVETSSSCAGGGSSANNSGAEGSSAEAGSDQYGSLQFECPKCKFTNTREPGKLVPRCQRCKADVRC